METDRQPSMWSGDSQRVTIDEPQDLQFWTRELRCTEAELRDALYKVGTSAAAVRLFLRFR